MFWLVCFFCFLSFLLHEYRQILEPLGIILMSIKMSYLSDQIVMRKLISVVYVGLILLSFISCSPNSKESENWCDKPFRKGWENYKEIATSHPWFKVYSVGDSVYAIYEPYNWQEVISYLIIGTEKALLFDTGMGLDSIQSVVKQLTSLPVTVVNSHTHFDHIGGNADFTNILGIDTAYTHTNSKGWSHESIKQEVSPAAFCPETLSSVDTASYHIRPYSISGFIGDGSVIDLGGRQIDVITIPGHAPDGVALLDRSAGLLWTGDTYYEGPLWLFFPGTDLDAFESSISKMATLTPILKHLLPAHNLPLIPPGRLLEVKEAIALIRAGQEKGELVTDGGALMKDVIRFKFEHFSFLIRKDLLSGQNFE